MKTAILYYSNHHGNTQKLVDAIAAECDVTLVDVVNGRGYGLSDFDCIGIASGIYAGSFGKPILNFVEEYLPQGKKVFLLYTYAKKMGHYENAIRKVLEGKKAEIIGEYDCPGYNTFGPFKLVGGTGKGHPTDEEIRKAVDFYRGLDS